jgi:transposase-like protein
VDQGNQLASARCRPEDMPAWSARPLLPVYAAVSMDAIYVKVP